MSEREAALERIASLAREHGLGADEITAALRRRGATAGEQAAGLAGRVLAYLGGIFVLAGIGVFIALNWDALNPLARVAITLGPGLAAFAVACAQLGDARRRAARAPLFLIAAVLQPAGILVAIDEFAVSGGLRHAAAAAAAAMLLQQGAAFWKYRTTLLLSLATLFALWLLGTGLDLLGAPSKLAAVALGAGLIGWCVGLDKTAHRSMLGLWYLIGAALFYTGLFQTLERSAAELLFLAAAAGGLALSAWLASRSLLVASTIAILGYIGYFTHRHFVESLGWPLALVGLGLAMAAMSAMALRLDRRHIASKS